MAAVTSFSEAAMTIRITDLGSLTTLARKQGVVRRAACVAAHEAHALESSILARREGLIHSTLIGDERAIDDLLIEAGESPGDYLVIPSASTAESVRKAVELVRAGEVDFLIKGILETGELMAGLLDREQGIRRPDAIVCPVALMQSPLYHKIFALADVGITLYPDVDRKIRIMKNCVWMMNRIGVAKPRVALLSATEKVNPKMQDTVDNDVIKQKYLSGEINDCIVEGPISLDLAIDGKAAAVKGYSSPVAGDADILIVPDMVSGNLLIKGMGFFGQMMSADLIVGLEVPVIFGSRGGPVEGKLRSIALAVLVSEQPVGYSKDET
jgi:phosphate butyryltransferase